MQFANECEFCCQNKVIFDEKKQRLRKCSRQYYLRNREKIIIRNVKNYYRKKRL
jgi:hypothetical protein